MGTSHLIAARVSPETKVNFRTLAEHQQMTESALLKQLIELTVHLFAMSRRAAPKLVHKLIFSMPAGTPPEKVLAAATRPKALKRAPELLMANVKVDELKARSLPSHLLDELAAGYARAAARAHFAKHLQARPSASSRLDLPPPAGP